MVLIMDRQRIENEIRHKLRLTRSRISNTEKTKFYRENVDFQNMIDSLKQYIKIGARGIADEDGNKTNATKLSELSDSQLLAYNAKLSEWEKLAGRKGFEDVMEKRIKGIADYVYQDGDYTIAKGDKGFAILNKGKMYKMSYSDISDFWKKFGELYRKSRLKDLKDYEDEGVAYIFELYYDKGITDVDDLIDAVDEAYQEETQEKVQMLRLAEEDLKSLPKFR